MKFVIQRVTEATCKVVDEVAEEAVSETSMGTSGDISGEVTGSIRRGFLVLVGIAQGDTVAIADKMVKKLLGLRIFEDVDGKTNLSLKDVGGSLLIVSQFTLYADCRKGNRPSFINAGAPELAESLYEYVIKSCADQGYDVQRGRFGASMQISLLNDGPFTIILDSDEICGPSVKKN